MSLFSRHYHQLVGLNQDWVIADVQLDVRNRTLTLPLEFVGDPGQGQRAVWGLLVIWEDLRQSQIFPTI
jgi:hypothetical protein